MDGIRAKNSRTRAESLGVLGIFIENQGVDLITEKYVKQIGKKADDKDPSIRDHGLNACAAIYKYIQEDLFQILGKTISEKAIDLLKKRFKFLGFSSEVESSRPSTYSNNVRTHKSPAVRNSNLNSSIGKKNQFAQM